MPLLLDCYNILHVVGVLPPELAGIDAEGLAELISHSRWRNTECWLVCDGVPKSDAWRSGPTRICYAGAGRTADEAIEQLVNASSTPRQIQVVSNDREVQRAARRRKCQVIDAETFLGRLAIDADRNRTRKPIPPTPAIPLDQRQVERWIKEFGVDDVLHLESSPSTTPQPQPQEPPPPPPPPDPDASRAIDATSSEEIDLDDLANLDMDELIDEHGHWRTDPGRDKEDS